MFQLLDSTNAERHTERTGSCHFYPQASGVCEKSFLRGEPEAQPIMACFPPGGKMNLQIPIYGPPCITGPHSPSKSRHAQPLMEVRSMEAGGGARASGAEPLHMGPEYVW